MYKIIIDPNEIRKCQHILDSKLNKYLPNTDLYKIGFPGGQWDCKIIYNDKIWFYTYEIHEKDSSSPRFWNGFGLAATLNKSKSNNIITEINVPTNGLNKKISGFYAIDKQNRVYFFHRGRLGGGRKGIGKNSFLNWSSYSLTTVNDGKYNDEAILIGMIDSNNFIDKIFEFLKDVSSFKKYITTAPKDDSIFLSDEELLNKIHESLPKLNKPEKSTSENTSYNRSEHIKEYALRKAKGKCQLCDKSAPFKTKSGRPYLEVHHIVWLSKEGGDTPKNVTALCPNCHRRMHILDNQDDINLLISKNT